MARRIKSTVLAAASSEQGACDRRYLIVFSDDDQHWVVALGNEVYCKYTSSLSIAQSQAVRFAPNPRAAVADMVAPSGRVFRVTDIDSGDFQEFVVEHARVTG